MEDIRKQVKVHRTREGNLFEIAAAVLVVVMWLSGVWVVLYGGVPFWVTLCECFPLTYTVPFVFFCAYHPDIINVPMRLTNETQVWVMVRMLRVLGIEICLFGITLCFLPMPGVGEGVALPCIIGYVVVICATIAYYCVKARRLR